MRRRRYYQKRLVNAVDFFGFLFESFVRQLGQFARVLRKFFVGRRGVDQFVGVTFYSYTSQRALRILERGIL